MIYFKSAIYSISVLTIKPALNLFEIGIFNRPSTAERFRKQLQDANIGYDVLLILEKL